MSFDTFLSHNSNDKPAVRDLKRRLVGRRLVVWFDEDELQPGIPWQQLLEDGIKNSASVAVLIGKDGLGPWEDEEMQAALRLAVSDKRPVIPVLMPGAPSRPELPMFLGNRTWVDLRGGLTSEGLDRLAWGITGQKPSSLDSSAESGDSAATRFAAALTALAECKPQVEWLTSIISDCCLRFPAAINEEFNFAPLETCIDEAVQHGIQGEEEAGDRWGKTNSLQAVTLVLVGLAHAIKRSPQALLLIADTCESMLKNEKIGLRMIWPEGGKDELYRTAVETNDFHDVAVYEFLEEGCER